MSKKLIAVLSVILLLGSFAVIAATGSRYTAYYSFAPREGQRAEEFSVTPEEPGIVAVSGVRLEGSKLKYDLTALGRGKTYLYITNLTDDMTGLQSVYVHRWNIITVNSFFGNCSMCFLLPLSVLIVTVLLFIDRIHKFRIETRVSFYRYRNIMNLGLIVFMAFFILQLVQIVVKNRGIEAAVYSVLATAETFAHVVLPVAFVVFVLVSISNVNLMRKEGVNPRNMLGFLLGLGICFMTILPEVFYTFNLRHQIVDIFNEKGLGTQLYSFFSNVIFYIVAYLECILVGTIVFSVQAGRHMPAFDKDYMLILGCKIRADGSLPPLLRARADKAMEFANLQREATGKALVFVPSGGKGADECIAEADAIKAYLLAEGVPEEQILAENQSANTEENMRNSMALIQDHFSGEGAPAVAFATTNYHVFRSGLIALEQGYRMEGVGSTTKRYFWVNAFIREFIATLVSQKRRHLQVIAMLIAGVAVLVMLNYLSIILF
ncbi:MAG: YdcF family protein [Clostridia bacterium]|nr:YdcF family protein [Clostridia bacterium]